MPFFAGMDWTEYRKPLREIRGAGLVAVSDLEKLDALFQAVKVAHGLPADKVFHAYEDTEDLQLTLLRSVITADMRVCFGAVLYDSQEGRISKAESLSATDFTQSIGRHLLREFLAVHSLNRLVVDRELEGDKQERKFKMAVRSICHAIPISSPEIQFCSAKENKPISQLVQLADVFIYNLYRWRRGVVKLTELQDLLQTLPKSRECIIKILVEWEN